MVSTRRQSQGLTDGDATLALRSKQSPPQTEPKVLRDGTVHGEDATPVDRPSKRRRTGPNSAVANTSENEESLLQQQSEAAHVEKATGAKAISDTIEVATPTHTNSAKRKRGSAKQNVQSNAHPEEKLEEPRHHRFDSEEPDPGFESPTAEASVPGAQKEEDDDDDDQDDEDEAPEEVTTTSSSLLRGLPSSLPPPSSQPTKKNRNTKKRRDQEQIFDARPSTTTAQEEGFANETSPAAAPTTAELGNDAPPPPQSEATNNVPSQISIHTTPIPKPASKKLLHSKTKKDIFDRSTNTLIRHLDTPSSSPILSSKKPGSLPMKASSQSRNMRDQLLHRHRQSLGPKMGFQKSGKGFFVR